MTLQEWCNASWEGPIPVEGVSPDVLGEAPSRLQVYAALVDINGGRTQVGSWGVQEFGAGRYGVRGLNQDQAMCLISLAAYVGGLLAARNGEEFPWFTAAVNAEWIRVEAVTEKRASC